MYMINQNDITMLSIALPDECEWQRPLSPGDLLRGYGPLGPEQMDDRPCLQLG